MNALTRKPWLLTGKRGPSGPSLDLSFMNPGTLDPRITFTRASTGTYFDAAGILRTAAVDQPRWDYTNGVLQGLLMEQARSNSVTNSGPLTNFVPSFCSPVAAAAVAPDGTTTAIRLAEDASLNEHGADFTFTPSPSNVYTASIFAKADTRTHVNIGLRVSANWTGGASVVVHADLGAGTVAVISGTGRTSIRNCGNGWFRISVSGTSVAAPTSSFMRIGLTDNVGTLSYQGDGASGAFFWGAQLEVINDFMSSYVPTTSSGLTRQSDSCTITPANMAGWFSPAGIGSWASEHTHHDPTIATGRATVIGRIGGAGGVSPAWINASNQNLQTDSSGTMTDTSGYGTDLFTKVCNTWDPTTAKMKLGAGSLKTSTALTGGYSSLLSTGIYLMINTGSISDSCEGYIRRLRYWPRTLSNNEMAAVTT